MVETKVRGARDRGAVTIIVAILFGLGVFLPMTALVVDVGSIYVESEELTSGADAAAMTVAKQCVAGKCTTGNLPSQLAKAKTDAGANAKDGRTSITELCGNWGSLPACTSDSKKNLSACIGIKPTGNYVEVRVKTETEDGGTLLPPILARTFVGNETYDGTSVGGCARVAANDVCVSAAEATYRHTFNGPAGTASITADRVLCPGQEQPFTLVSYTAPASTFATPQYVYDYETKTIDSSNKSLTFKVDVPVCYTQVDFVFGSKVVNPLTYAAYGSTKVGSDSEPGRRSVGPEGWYNGGTRPCDPRATSSAKSNGDKSLTLTLASRAGANVDAVFTVTAGGKAIIHRVTKGTSKAITIAAADAGSVQVQDSIPEGNTFDTVTYKWSSR